MAIQYMLFAECKAEQLESFVRHFEQLTLRLEAGLEPKLSISRNKNNTVRVWSKEISDQLIALQGAVNATELGFLLLKHLLNAPDFIFARVGKEVDIMLHNDFVADFKSEGEAWIPNGMVLHESFWDELEPPRLRNMYREFRPNYYWNPYSGEQVNVAWLKEFPHLQKLAIEFRK